MELSHAILKKRQREIRDTFPTSLGLRVHRSLSWLERAEREADDADAQFIFLWIAFNAAYANDIRDRSQFSEKSVFSNFIRRLVCLDKEKLLYNTVWQEFPKSIRIVINNRYVFQPFWDYQNGIIDEHRWEALFESDNAAASKSLGRMDTATVLMTVLERLYTLRNQIIHGGATWNSRMNRDQIRDGSSIMNKLVPSIINIMMDGANEVWGDACYPVIE